ncbi:rRNA maturation RNase YbeY [Aquimarina sp. AD10]|uniref:rRNA maturation RNase YbeY n=1 Tax=Aquimarina sp. AD10 TaxID=1714849 RepID=UPI000E52CFA1|nr:rRNA maturation RNase YbeY [Aquimarina sp. AD10]AXT61873.1 rRNA maturation RNase YbeY [Aquimarina sp. AD10]RKN02669.1 rRNA maturation RNase YbeY [Aquimarina sp. AD10]
MINFFYEGDIDRLNEDRISSWISEVISSESKEEGEISFIFCDDEYLLKLNKEFLNHDTYTDIISFDNSLGNELNGDIFISTERVFENAKKFKVSETNEMSRVIVHGILHLCGYKDKSDDEAALMRNKEDEKLLLFHVEQ